MAEKRKVFDVRFSILALVQVLSLAVLVYIAVTSRGEPTVDVNNAHWRNVAAKLHSAGVTEQAARFYEKYLTSSIVDPEGKAKVAYSLGEMYEQSDQAEQALAWFYQVSLFDPSSEHQPQAGKKIVALLEKMKKFSAASRALSEQTQLNKHEQPFPAGAIEVARVGDKKIFLHQVQEAMDRLPETMRKTLENKQAKQDFLKKFVAEQLLYDKAQRLNYINDPKIKKQLVHIKKQILVQKVIEQEVQNKISMDAGDIKNYYQAHQDNYVQKARAKVSLIKVKSEQDAKDVVQALKNGKSFPNVAKEKSLDVASKDKGGVYTGEIIAGQGFSVFPAEVSKQIFAIKQGQYTDPILSHGAFYIFKLTAKTAEQRPSFEQITERVRRDYRMEKAQKLYQQLIEETLASQKVELYAERMN